MSAFNDSANVTRYYFPEFIANDNLSILAIEAKEILQQNDTIVRIFNINKEFLYGHSPRQILFLMKQNNRSIFSSRPGNEISQTDEKYQRSSPVTRNPDISNLPRRHLPIDDDEEESVYHSEILETSSPVMGSCQNPTTDKSLTCDEEFESSIGSTSSEELPSSAEITKMSANLTMDEKQSESAAKFIRNTGESSPESTHYSTPIRHQTVKVSSKDKAILSPTIVKIVTSAEQFTSPTGSTNSREAGNEESPRSAEIAKMTADLTMDEKQSKSPAKLIGNLDEGSHEFPHTSTPIKHQTAIQSSKDEAILSPTTEKFVKSDEKCSSPIGTSSSRESANEESPRSAEIAKMTANLTMDEKELGSPSKVVGATNQRSQESPRTTEITEVSFSLKVDDKECGSLIQVDQMTDSSATNTVSLNPDSDDKDSITDVEGIVTISKPTVISVGVPSPAKKSKICSVSVSGIHKLPDSAEKVGMTDSSLEDDEYIYIPIQGDEMIVSLNEAIKGIRKDTRKRKSSSPRSMETTPFKLIPKVVQLAGKEEIDIEVPCDYEKNTSPTTSRSLSGDYGSNLTKNKNPIMDESKTDTSPEAIKGYSGPSEGSNFISTDDVFAGKDSSDISSIAATKEKSDKSESSLADIEIDPNSLKFTVRKFKALLKIRDSVVEKSFFSLLSFQNGIRILSAYVYNLSCTILKIQDSAKEYLTKELDDIINDTSAIALKLRKKIKSWETDLDLDTNTWHKCFAQIEKLKTQYEPLVSNDGEPVIDFDNVQVYEFEMKTIWKIMDDMIMMGDSRRALFAQIAFDVEKLMKMFVKCLIHVGILHPR